VPPELAELGIESHREVIVSPYRILYRVVEDTVRVVAVLGGRRDMQRIYLERLTRTGD
jgi:toxin ParE1/3/4